LVAFRKLRKLLLVDRFNWCKNISLLMSLLFSKKDSMSVSTLMVPPAVNQQHIYILFG